MKMFTSILIALTSFNVFAIDRDVEIECNLTTSQSAVVEKISLYSASDEIKLQYRNGSIEIVKPIDAKSEGLFGTENFSADLVWNNGQVFAPATAAGPLYVRFDCFLTPTIPFERCISQGTHETAQFSGVHMNLNGKLLKFFGPNICSRTDHSL